MRTIFLTAYHSFIGRNILGTKISEILKTTPDLRVVVLTFPYKKEFFESNYAAPNFVIEGLDIDYVIRSKKAKFWYRLAFLLQNTNYVQNQRKERLNRHRNIFGYLNYWIVNLTALTLSKLRIARKIYRFLDKNSAPKNILDEMINKYNPDLFFSTDIFGEWDVALLRCAAARGIKSVGMIRSWDNTTTKGVLRCFPDHFIALSPHLVDELKNFHDWNNSAKTMISGLPQFDGWETGPTEARNSFCRKLKIDSSKKIVIFAPAGSVLSDTDWEICQILKDAIKNKELPSDLVFVVRNHPHHPADLSKFEPDEHFVIESPGRMLRENDPRGAEMSKEDNNHLRNTVYYSEIIMYIATSLGLDASVYDKPQILISFDGFKKKPYVVSVERYNHEDVLINLVSLGGTIVVWSPKELVAAVKEYLDNPSLKREGRQKTIDRHIYKIDGQAASRIANYVVSLLDH